MGIKGDMIKGFEFKKFATPRIIGGIVIVVIVLWALVALFGTPYETPHQATAPTDDSPVAPHTVTTGGNGTASTQAGGHDTPAATADQGHGTTAAAHDQTQMTASHDQAQMAASPTAAAGHQTGAVSTGTSHQPAATGAHGQTASKATSAKKTETAAAAPASGAGGHQPSAADSGHGTQPAAHGSTAKSASAGAAAASKQDLPATAMIAPVHKPVPRGVAFVEASVKPLYFELEDRWWGWRPNDIINVTDNVDNYQLGVLEVTRRMIVALAERISRTGTTDAYDENLEAAMNWFMVKAGSYWFPSAESKYRDGLEEMQVYLEKLKAGKARFYTRTDNLIPLLASFEDLLGSCDENLVKQVNDDGEAISFFTVDDYFFYTKGVASSMATVLEAVHHDFLLTLESRNATDLLHHAIVACQRAAAIDPWIILDPELSSTFANHRANMAAPISHARFYLGQLIKTLST